jgi:hypothetical protein
VAGCLTACVSLSGSDNPLSSLPHSQRLVIQFKPNRLACDTAGIDALSRSVGVSLAVVRPMAKGACVVNQFASHSDHFRKQQNKIAGHDSVQWVEPDQRMHAF